MKGGHTPLSRNHPGWFCVGSGCHGHERRVCLAPCRLHMLVDKGKEVTATCAFVCDEETGGQQGIRYLLAKKMIKPMDCLIAEPSPVRHPCIGQKGLLYELEMKFTGTPAHGSLYPAVGVSAVMEALSLLEWVKIMHNREYPVDERLKKESLNILLVSLKRNSKSITSVKS